MAAHVGTAGNDEGTVNGDGLGVGLGEGGGEGESDVEGDGLVRTATVGADPQPDTSITVASASSPTLRLTGHRNARVWREVTDRPPRGSPRTYGEASACAGFNTGAQG
jgi:hypothetical protein